MPSKAPDAAAQAAAVLAVELAELTGTDRSPVQLERSTAARDWGLSGAMDLTGRPGGPVRLAPGGPASWMRAAAALPWMHGDDCRYGADIGLTWRGQSWLAERGLRLAHTGPGQDQAITPPRPIVPARPRWISDGPA